VRLGKCFFINREQNVDNPIYYVLHCSLVYGKACTRAAGNNSWRCGLPLQLREQTALLDPNESTSYVGRKLGRVCFFDGAVQGFVNGKQNYVLAPLAWLWCTQNAQASRYEICFLRCLVGNWTHTYSNTINSSDKRHHFQYSHLSALPCKAHASYVCC
jgi:hypothetical protein